MRLVSIALACLISFAVSPAPAHAKSPAKGAKVERKISEAPTPPDTDEEDEGAEEEAVAPTPMSHAPRTDDGDCKSDQHRCRVGGGCNGCTPVYRCYPKTKKCPPLPM